MVAVKLGILPVGLDGHNTPAIAACRGPDAGAFGFAAVMAEGSAIMGDGEQGVAAGPSVGAGAELGGQA